MPTRLFLSDKRSQAIILLIVSGWGCENKSASDIKDHELNLSRVLKAGEIHQYTILN